MSTHTHTGDTDQWQSVCFGFAFSFLIFSLPTTNWLLIVVRDLTPFVCSQSAPSVYSPSTKCSFDCFDIYFQILCKFILNPMMSSLPGSATLTLVLLVVYLLDNSTCDNDTTTSSKSSTIDLSSKLPKFSIDLPVQENRIEEKESPDADLQKRREARVFERSQSLSTVHLNSLFTNGGCAFAYVQDRAEVVHRCATPCPMAGSRFARALESLAFRATPALS